MAYKSRSSVITVNGRTWWINSKVSGIYTTMMKSMIGQLDAMLSHHSRIHVVRFDLRQYEYTATNKRMTDFNARLIKWLKARYGLKRVGYMWVREQERKKHQHYHYALILDGHKVKHPSAVLDKVREIWEHMDGSDWRPKNCYYNVKRDDVESLQAAIWRVSYLAKGRGKGYKPAQTKNYGTSRVKKIIGMRSISLKNNHVWGIIKTNIFGDENYDPTSGPAVRREILQERFSGIAGST